MVPLDNKDELEHQVGPVVRTWNQSSSTNMEYNSSCGVVKNMVDKLTVYHGRYPCINTNFNQLLGGQVGPWY